MVKLGFLMASFPFIFFKFTGFNSHSFIKRVILHTNIIYKANARGGMHIVICINSVTLIYTNIKFTIL